MIEIDENIIFFIDLLNLMRSEWLLMHHLYDLILNTICKIFKRIPEIKEWYVWQYVWCIWL